LCGGGGLFFLRGRFFFNPPFWAGGGGGGGGGGGEISVLPGVLAAACNPGQIYLSYPPVPSLSRYSLFLMFSNLN
jgi:hypothetical protein